MDKQTDRQTDSVKTVYTRLPLNFACGGYKKLYPILAKNTPLWIALNLNL